MTVDITIPTVGESITEVTLGAWLKKDGDFVEKDEIICSLESDKAELELPAESAGLLKIIVPEGEDVAVGGVIGTIDQAAQNQTDKSAAQEPIAPTEESIKPSASSHYSSASGHPSPAAAKILKEKNIDSKTVIGTGVAGRVTKTDALKAEPAKAPVAKTTAPAKPIAPMSDSRSTTQERMSNLRKTIAKRLVSAKNETAMLTTFNEVDMKAIMDIRKRYKERFKDKHETGLGFMSFFTKAVCIALQEWPAVNAQLQDNQILYHHYCDVSIAVSSPKGLVVPVIRNAETLSFDEIEKEVIRLAKKARDSKLSIEEMTGGTFTITNGGIFGSMLSTPILNPPQSAILGMHNIVQRPVAIDGQVTIRPIMYLALSYDHRIVDGRESVSFLYRVKELLEDPVRLLLRV